MSDRRGSLVKPGFILVLGLLACSCGPGRKAEEKAAFVLKDQLGREVRFERPAQRVVSLAPSVTETIYALGAQDRLVGVTTYCNYPPEAQAKEKVGDFFLPNLERIVALNPDVIVLVATGQSQTLTKLEGLGLRVLVLNPESIDQTLESFRLLGTMLGLENNAELVIREVRERADAVRLQARARPEHPLVFIEIDSAPLITCGGKSFLGELIRFAGGRNLFEDLPQPYGVIPAERVVAGAPEVVLIAHPNAKAKDVKERLGWGAVPAVKADRIYDDLDPDILTRPGPRTGKAAEMLFRALYQRP